MKFFLYKQKLLFYQGDGYLWSHCCMNNLYISHKSLYAPTYSFLAIGSMLVSLLRVTSWFDTVCNIVTRWVNLEKTICMNMNYEYLTTIFRSFLTQIYVFLVIFTIFHFDLEKFISKNCKNIFFYQKFVHLGENSSKYCSRIILLMFMQLVFSKVQPACHNIANGIKTRMDSKMTDKHAAD